MRRLALVLFAILAVFPARADYSLPPVEEQYFLIATRWELKTTQGRECLTEGNQKIMVAVASYALRVEHEGRSYEWPIDLFWLADRTDSDAICTGSYKERMTQYLDRVKQSRPGNPLVFELVRPKGSTDFIVAGLSSDPAKHYESGCLAGSRTLGLSAEEVTALGSEGTFSQAVSAAAAEGWKKFAKAAAGDDARWLKPGTCGDEESQQAHQAENCLVVDWECPRCRQSLHGLRWDVCESCAAALGRCLECGKKKAG